MDEIDQRRHLIELVEVNRARAVAIFDVYTAAAFASIAYDRALIRASELAVQESQKLLSRVKRQHGL